MGILGVVLAGGSSLRFGGDKARAVLGEKTLLRHVCERAAPQVDKLVINRTECEAWMLPREYECLSDDWPGRGPLAGIVAALDHAASTGFAKVASFPCDAPFFPTDLVCRLDRELGITSADYCIARSSDREQRAFALWNVRCVVALKAHFLAGMRRLGDVPHALTVCAVDFPAVGNDGIADCFLNINTPDDMVIANRQLALLRTVPA